MTKILKILGPPGTGKTTKLLELVKKEMENYSIQRIGYFSFTKKATEEVRDRIIKDENFDFEEKDFKWFCTLHSCCLNSINKEGREVIQSSQLRKVAEKTGIIAMKTGINSDTGLTNNDYFDHIHLARQREMSLKEHYKEYADPSKIEWMKLKLLDAAYTEYKKVNNYLDFDDMLCEAIEKDCLPDLDVIFVDEAQDLSSIQWKVVNSFKNIDKLYLAGDDDQAIYRWMGADVEKFIAFEAEEEVLPKSYRVKKKIQDFAQRIISPVKNRIPKEWEPKDEEGVLKYHTKIQGVDLSEGEWLLLARDKYILAEHIEKWCKDIGLWYVKKDKMTKSWKKPLSKKLFDAYEGWNALVAGESIDKKTIKKIFFYKHVDDEVNDKIENLAESHLFDLDSLKVVLGNFLTGTWDVALDKINTVDRAYITRLMRRNIDLEKEFKEPRIKLSTIHAAKGGECDNVLLAIDMGRKTYIEYMKNSDDERRVFYVGATRAKNELHILLNQTKRYLKLQL
jgi:DNA helicase-2/ATP-dependent DNA helicase PcrA